MSSSGKINRLIGIRLVARTIAGAPNREAAAPKKKLLRVILRSKTGIGGIIEPSVHKRGRHHLLNLPSKRPHPTYRGTAFGQAAADWSATSIRRRSPRTCADAVKFTMEPM